jgi:hypothetical protein
MSEIRDIKYVAREFSDYKQELIEFAKNYFPDSYNDFSPTSPGMMFIEMASYVGDILSFYQDTQLQETFLQYAKDPSNLYAMAYMMGYTPKVTNVSEVVLSISQNISADSNTSEPDWNQAAVIAEDSVVTSTSSGNAKFFIENKIDFTFSSSFDPTDIVISKIEGDSPVEFLLTKKTKAYSGTVKTLSKTYTTAEKFNTLTVDDSNIIGVLEIIDGDEDKWYEVPFLGQDTVFVDEANTGQDADKVSNTIKLQKVPKRFVTRFTSQGQLQIQFGAGTVGGDDTVFTPDPSNVGFNYNFTSNTNNFPGVKAIDKAYDPSNFLYTGTYGLAPSNTTLTIKYLVGGGVAANVPANTLTNFTPSLITFPGNDASYQSTISSNNVAPAVGGKDGDSIDEIRQNSLRAFAEQKRTVTLQDYTVRALSLSPKFGTVAKVLVTQDQLSSSNSTTDSIIDSNPLALSLFVLAYDIDKKLIPATDTLKNNLKTYMSNYMPVTDALNIKDPFVINIGVNFDILVRPNYNSRDVLVNCNIALRDYFEISKWQINQPINISTLYSLLDRVKGVQTVSKVEIINKQGGMYSTSAYDIKGATRNNIVYPSLDTMIFEVKFLDTDINGRTTTL